MLNNHLRTAALAAAVALSLGTVAGCAVTRGQQTAGAFVDDTQITTAIKAKYAKDPSVAATAINVETMNNTVQLSGFAKSQEEKDRAGAIAADTEGVKAVRNNVIVQQP